MILGPAFVIIFLTSGALRLLPLSSFCTDRFFPSAEGFFGHAEIRQIFPIATAVLTFFSFAVAIGIGFLLSPFLSLGTNTLLFSSFAGLLVILAGEKLFFALSRPSLPAPLSFWWSMFSFMTAAILIAFFAITISLFLVFLALFFACVILFCILHFSNQLLSYYSERGIWLFEGLSALPLLFLAIHFLAMA